MKIYLDLLPLERKDALRRKKSFITTIGREVLFLFPIAVFIVILVNIYLILGIQKEDLKATGSGQQTQGEYKELHTYEDTFDRTNNAVIFLTRAQSGHIYWSQLIAKISDIAGEHITLTEISTKDYQVFLTGKAISREDLIAFRDALNNSGCADNIDLPLSNLTTPTDVVFQLDFTVRQECIKKTNS